MHLQHLLLWKPVLLAVAVGRHKTGVRRDQLTILAYVST